MSCDYGAVSLIGIQVPIEDLISFDKVTKRLCEHKEAVGNKYCPVCGKRSEHLYTTRTPKHGLSEEVEYSIGEKLLGKYPVHFNPEEKDCWIGIYSSGVVYVGNEPSRVETDLIDFHNSIVVEEFIKDLIGLGIWKEGYEISLYTIPYISC